MAVETVTETTPSAEIGVRDLLEAGLHFGHQTKRWNPKMKRYIFDTRNGIHIIDLAKSLVHLQAALEFVRETVLRGRKILLVGTKKQAREIVRETAEQTKQYYVTHRWLGGTLTNNVTIRQSIKRMREIEALEKSNAFETMHKKEVASLKRELEKLRRNLSGIADMTDLPGAIFVIDINREAIAVKEANTLNIPLVAIVDTNCDPDPIQYVVPGNDDAIRAIKLIAGAVANTIQTANDEYGRIAAEAARRKAEADAAAAKAAAERAAASKALAAEKAAATKATAEKTAREKAARKKEAKPAAPAEAPSVPAEPPAETPVETAPAATE